MYKCALKTCLTNLQYACVHIFEIGVWAPHAGGLHIVRARGWIITGWLTATGSQVRGGSPDRATPDALPTISPHKHTSCYDGKESSLLQIFCWGSKSTIFANIGWSQDSKEKHNFYWNCLATTVFTYLLSMLLTMYTTYKLSLDFESAIWHEFDV